MQLEGIKHELTISEIASVYAQKKINDLKNEESELTHKYNELFCECEQKLNSKAKEIFTRSKYFEAFNMFFGDYDPQIFYQLTVSPEFSGLINFEKLPLMYLNKSSNEGIITLFLRMERYGNNGSQFFEIEEKLSTVGFGYVDLGTIQMKLNAVYNDLKKDWEKIYSTHFIAKKMAEMGFNETISIPDLPKIELNSNFS